jgi:hypothetical protein
MFAKACTGFMSCDSGHTPVVGSCGNSNETSDSIKRRTY